MGPVKDHGGPKKRRQLYVKRTISYLLWFPGCPSVLEPIRLQHRHCRICRHQIQLKSEVSDLHQETGEQPKTPQNQIKEGPQSRCGWTSAKSSMVGGVHRLCSLPKRQKSEVCLRTKMTRAPCRRRTGEAIPRAETFCDLITADQVLNEEGERNDHRHAVVVQDLTTNGFNLIRATQRLHRRWTRVSEGRAVGKAEVSSTANFFGIWHIL